MDTGGKIANSLKEGSPTRLTSTEAGLDDPCPPGLRSWLTRRGGILSTFTTNERLSITTSFLPGGVPLVAEVRDANRAPGRLEQLESELDGKEKLRRLADLSQADYVSRINQLNTELLKAWSEDRRVDSVKIVIQCTKLLADVPVPAFYPSQFVLVTDILDTFGRLVAQRLRDKADEELRSAGKSPLGFGPNWAARVPPTTQETARNWFFKVASIRELLPRLYVEATLLRTLPFLLGTGDAFGATGTHLRRLCSMARGLSNPLVATYARAFVSRMGLHPSLSEGEDHLWLAVNDILRGWPKAHKRLLAEDTKPMKKNGEVGTSQAVDWEQLFEPALNWLLSCLCLGRSADDFLPLLEFAKQPALQRLLLLPLLSALPKTYIAESAVDMVKIILSTVPKSPSHPTPSQEAHQAQLVRALGLALLEEQPSPSLHRPLLREMWKTLMRMKDLPNYMEAAEIWLEFACRHFGPREVNTLLEDITTHLLPDKAYQNYYPKLLRMLDKLVVNMSDFEAMFGMERFPGFLDLLKKDSVKVEACGKLLEAFGRFQLRISSDQALSHHVLGLAKTLHDSLNATSLEDEKRSAMSLINKCLGRFSFFQGTLETAEEELNWLVEARGSFCDLDPVVAYALARVDALAMAALQQLPASRKRAYLSRACVAYAFIAIPSLLDPLLRLRHYSQSAGVALACSCVGQAEDLLKAAIQLIPQLPVAKSADESVVIELVQGLFSLLLVVPDPPAAASPLFLFQGLLKALERVGWREESSGRFRLSLSALAWLSAAAQSVFLYSVPGVEANDALYGGSAEYRAQVAALSDQLLAFCLGEIGAAETTAKRARLSILLLQTLLSHGDQTDAAVQGLAAKCATLARKDDVSRGESEMREMQTELSLGWVRRSYESDVISEQMTRTEAWLRQRAATQPDWLPLCQKLKLL